MSRILSFNDGNVVIEGCDPVPAAELLLNANMAPVTDHQATIVSQMGGRVVRKRAVARAENCKKAQLAANRQFGRPTVAERDRRCQQRRRTVLRRSALVIA
jgi:hypothetical protein